MQRKYVSLLLGLVMLIGIGVMMPSPAGTQPADKLGVVTVKPGEPIHIAYMLVVSGSEASLGEDSKRGIEIAIDDKGGKLLDHPIKLSGADSGCNAEGGAAAATKLASDPTIVAVIGSTCSSEARPGAPIITRAGMVMVSPSNTAPFLTDANRGADFAGYLRTAHNDLVQGAVAAKFAWERLQVKTAATIHDGSPYAEQLQAVFADTFKKFGGTITSQEAVAPTDTDMRPVLTRIAKASPALIYYPIFVAAGGQVTTQAKKIAGLEKTTLMGADGLFSPDFLKAAGKAAEGMYLSSPDFSAFGDKYAQDFLPKHEKKYGGKTLSAFHAHAYDATMMVFAAIEKVAQKSADGTLSIGRQALRDALFATRDFKGLTGNLSCTPHGDCADPKIAVYQITAENLTKNVVPDKPIWKPF
jgi:branched-chain amino acid transport system substrate-binding protein